jgi:hypothetical protein
MHPNTDALLQAIMFLHSRTGAVVISAGDDNDCQRMGDEIPDANWTRLA